jgi:hypothetical protein
MAAGEESGPVWMNWADDIDELNRGSIERCLLRTFRPRVSPRTFKSERAAEEAASAAASDKKD